MLSCPGGNGSRPAGPKALAVLCLPSLWDTRREAPADHIENENEEEPEAKRFYPGFECSHLHPPSSLHTYISTMRSAPYQKRIMTQIKKMSLFVERMVEGTPTPIPPIAQTLCLCARIRKTRSSQFPYTRGIRRSLSDTFSPSMGLGTVPHPSYPTITWLPHGPQCPTLPSGAVVNRPVGYNSMGRAVTVRTGL
jgi:hypothetical protein